VPLHGVQVGASAYMTPSHEGALRYCCIKAVDHEGEDLLIKLKQQDVHSFISDARSEGGIVLVHCLVSHFTFGGGGHFASEPLRLWPLLCFRYCATIVFVATFFTVAKSLTSSGIPKVCLRLTDKYV